MKHKMFRKSVEFFLAVMKA